MLYPISEFTEGQDKLSNLLANYYYEGDCPQSGRRLQLPRTPLVEAIARGLMQQLSQDDRYFQEGKMYGVLLVQLPDGEQRVLKAFSGLLQGESLVAGWVPPIPGRSEVATAETRTLGELEAIKQELISLQQLPQRLEYERQLQEFERQLQQLSDRHQANKVLRQEKREFFYQTLAGEMLATALESLNEQSRQEGIERRQLKRQQKAVLQPLQQVIEKADTRRATLKQQRKLLSRQLQAQMHAAYSLTNFLGQSRSLQKLMPGGAMPTGTGDCCAPKLLHYAAVQGFKPLAMAEFWWGTPSANQDKVPGQFYGACAERCQPLMGFLLAGLQSGRGESVGLEWVYEDEWLIGVNKPSGLLSVPGRSGDRFDSVLSRLQQELPEGQALMAVHRLDLETSGVTIVARDRQTYRHLSQQFQQRQVCKVYEAVLSGCLEVDAGEIHLPLWGDPLHRPYQVVNEQYGKPSVTSFRTIAQEGGYTRVEFRPLTGRTHQLRVHAADVRGLGIPILGDRLYGCQIPASRLHLHARELSFDHPQLGHRLHLKVPTPF